MGAARAAFDFACGRVVYAARAVHAGDKAAGHDARGIVRHAALRGIFRISVLDGVACRLARHGEYSGCCGGNPGRWRGRGRLDVDCGVFRHDDRICRGRFGGKIRHEKRPRRDRLCAEGVRAARRKNLCRRLCAFGARHGHHGADRRGIVGAGAHGCAARACGRCICGAFAPLRARRPAESRARHGKACAVHGGAVFGVVRRGAPSARKPYPRRGAEYAERCVFAESRCGRRMRHDFSHA